MHDSWDKIIFSANYWDPILPRYIKCDSNVNDTMHDCSISKQINKQTKQVNYCSISKQINKKTKQVTVCLCVLWSRHWIHSLTVFWKDSHYPLC